MSQFFADQIDQLDLAIDQLAVRDRNFDRFALMLIDNVVELVLHQHAQNKLLMGRPYELGKKPKPEWKTALAATGRDFDAKVNYARETGVISAPMADSIKYLHAFRNSAYHQGRRHEGILHSLAVFYFRTACAVLGAYRPLLYGTYSKDEISHRAVKYLGTPTLFGQQEAFKQACARLVEVGSTFQTNLVEDLQADMLQTIDEVDRSLDFMSDNSPNPMTRAEIVRECQAWPLAWTDEGKEFAAKKQYAIAGFRQYVDWLGNTYPWAVKVDPVESWKKRHKSLTKEKNLDAALKKYCDFMKQTEGFREDLSEAVSQLDGYIQQQIDEMRGK